MKEMRVCVSSYNFGGKERGFLRKRRTTFFFGSFNGEIKRNRGGDEEVKLKFMQFFFLLLDLTRRRHDTEMK